MTPDDTADPARTPVDPASRRGWPSVTWRTQTWSPDDDPSLSRTQRLRNRGPFRYADPAPIASVSVDIDPHVAESARSATSMIERFDERAHGGIPFASILLRSESASSSQIEHLSASARRIALAALGDTRNGNATSIARNVDAMQAAVDLSESLDATAILAMHEKLGGGDDPDHAGRFRQEWVWIGGRSPVTATFVPTRHENVAPAIEDLVVFLRRTDIEPLTQAAIAHAQFETIHPFTDGNGRTGRALVSAILRHRGVASRMVVPISSGLLSDTEAYFAALTSYRAGDPHPLIEAFAEAAERAIHNATLLQQDMARSHQQVLDQAQRRTKNIAIMAELCSSEPAVTADMVVTQGIAPATAYRLCERLTAAGILRREGAIRGAHAWTVVPLTEALDAFAQRAGRRTFNRG